MNEEKSDYQEFDQTIGRLLRRIEKQRKLYMNEKLSCFGLRGSMYRFPLILDRHPGASQEFISERIGIDKSNNARLARKLEDLGYIERRPNGDNRRKYEIFLTESGKDLLPKIREQLNLWSKILVKGISSDEEKELIRLLSIMLENSERAENHI